MKKPKRLFGHRLLFYFERFLKQLATMTDERIINAVS